MNGGRKRRFPVTVVACSILVLVISVVTAQQVFDGNRQPAFVRRQPAFQQQPNQIQFQQNRNFVLPSASPLRHRNLFTRQISHRHRPRHRSSLRKTTHQPQQAHLTSRRVIPTLSHKRTRSRTVVSSFSSRTKPNVTRVVNANQRTTTIKSNNSRRQQQQFQPRQPFMTQRQQQFRFQPQQQRQQIFQRVPRVQNFQRAPIQNQQFFVRQASTRSPFSIRAPLSPMPFGSVQRTPSSIRRPSNRLSIRPPLPPSTTPQTLTTTTPIPSTSSSSPSTFPPSPTTTSPVSLPSSTHVATIHSVGGSLRRPIRVQQLQLNLRRKPQMTRGQFRRPQSNSKFPLTRHQPTHRVTKPDRVTRPIVSTTNEPITTTTEEEISLTVAGTTPEGIQRQSSNMKQVDDIEAAILQAVIESSSPEPPPSTTRRQRIHRIRPGQRHRPAPPPRVDAIEEAVLRAVLEATPSAPTPEEVTSTTEETTTVTIEEPIEKTTLKTESTSLFPAFATRRHGHRRPTTVIPPTLEMTTESTVSITESTTEPTTTTTEETTTSSEEPTTTVTEGTTTEQVTDITIALPEDDFEDINAKISTEDHQLHQIEKNVISALSTPTSTASSSPIPPSPLPSTLPSSPSPPSPPAPPTEFNLQQAGPPGSMPPSDDIVDELNGSSDFLQVAQRLHLLRRLLQ